MIKNKKLLYLLTVSVVCLTVLLTKMSSVNSSVVVESYPEFTALPIFTSLPEQQGSQQYFKLKVIPEKKYSLPVIINNTGKSSSSYSIKLLVAASNNKGHIDYASSPTLVQKNNLTNLAVNGANKKVTISPGSHKIIVFKIKIPKSGFPGIIAGGIYVRKELTANQKKAVLQHTVMLNQFAETIPVLLSEDFNNSVKTNLKISTITTSSSKKGINKLSLVINNSSPTLFGNTLITVKIYQLKIGLKKLVLSRNFRNLEFAPFAPLTLIVNTDRALKPGNYHFLMYVNSGKFSQSFNKKYKIVKDSKSYRLILKNDLLFNKSLLLYTIGFVLFLYGSWWLKKRGIKKRAD